MKISPWLGTNESPNSSAPPVNFASLGMSWEAIAAEMNRSVHTVRRWPERYSGMWQGDMISEINSHREWVVNDAVSAARIIMHK